MRRTGPCVWGVVGLLLLGLVGCSHPGQNAPTLQPPTPAPTVSAAPALTASPEPKPGPGLHVSVMQYCLCDGPRNQVQVKLKLQLVNNTNAPVKITPANIRVLVRGATPGGDKAWSPNQPTASLSAVNIDGAVYTAIPPNGNHAFEMLSPGGATWASFWNADVLAPGEAYFKDGPNQGDVVFYVPYSAGQLTSVDGVGVVTDDGQTIVGWEPATAWPPSPSSPRTF
jgi:hypothetical protein